MLADDFTNGPPEVVLSWFYAKGVTAFERSTSGPMLERAEQFYIPRPVAPPWGPEGPRGPQVSAQPTRETKGSQASEPELRTLIRYGIVSRRLRAIEASDPVARRALDLAYGDEGAKWARHARGRDVALYPLTAAGEALVRRARRVATGAGLELSDAERLRNEIDADSTSVAPVDVGRAEVIEIRRGLIMRAAREAVALMARANRAWALQLAAEKAARPQTGREL